jgi:hypothetical protein
MTIADEVGGRKEERKILFSLLAHKGGREGERERGRERERERETHTRADLVFVRM